MERTSSRHPGPAARPNETRGIIHKKLFGGIKGFIRGGPLGAIGGFLGGNGGGNGGFAAPFVAPGLPIGLQPFPEHAAPMLGPATCPPGFIMTASGCIAQTKKGGLRGIAERLIPGGETGFIPDFGEAVTGRYGAALEPATRAMEVSVCPRGAILGNDGLCYNKGAITNSQRLWPRGRRPLLTGGEMRCISIASAAAKKLQGKQKQLESMGMLKKPSRRRAPALAAGHVAKIKHD